METKNYIHKFRKVVTKKYVVTYADKRSEMPKVEPTINISGAFKEDATLTVAEAKELQDALKRVLARL